MTFIPHPINQRVNIDEEQLDAFSRLRVSNPTSQLYTQHQYDKNPLIWDEELTGAATSTHDADNSGVDLAVTTASGDKGVHQTIEHYRYQPGKSQQIFMTFTMAAAQTNLEQRVGYFDDADGIFLEQTGSTIQIVKRSSTSGSAVDTAVAQASWNLDTLDGTGASGLTLDLTKSQILSIDLQWLGVGRVRVGFDIAGRIILAHEFLNANSISGPYMTTANLPATYEIENTAVISSAATLKCGCAAISSEGGLSLDRGFPFSVDSTLGAGLHTIGASTEVPVLAIRPKATFNSIANHTDIFLENVEAFALGQPCLARTYYDPTVTGGVWTSVDANSVAEANDNITSISGGHVFNSWFVPAALAQGNRPVPGTGGRGITSALPITRRRDASVIPIVITLENLTTTATDGAASADWLELR
jgi:hypothetical protein